MHTHTHIHTMHTHTYTCNAHIHIHTHIHTQCTHTHIHKHTIFLCSALWAFTVSSPDRIYIQNAYMSCTHKCIICIYTYILYSLKCATPSNSTTVHYYLSTNNLINFNCSTTLNSVACAILTEARSDGKLKLSKCVQQSCLS